MSNTVQLSRLPNAGLSNGKAPAWVSDCGGRPSLDWRKLVALGVTEDEAKLMCDRLKIHELMQSYFHLLSRAGMPLRDAQAVARAIAKFDVVGTEPTQKQRAKLYHYATLVCRANLWRPNWL
jgi:hypothetical protein